MESIYSLWAVIKKKERKKNLQNTLERAFENFPSLKTRPSFARVNCGSIVGMTIGYCIEET
jgi:hypothetical protein